MWFFNYKSTEQKYFMQVIWLAIFNFKSLAKKYESLANAICEQSGLHIKDLRKYFCKIKNMCTLAL